ncbi:MAG TPA: DUF5615 family PIN-like protein [Cyclobacteriaceae bacterium]|nr:DUF5615 family PIN-like protein [Cyclobacteriaceae bacterium]
MKLLLDENISFRVLKSIISVFPQSIHVTNDSARLKRDFEIFEYARENNYTILTYDEDFYDLQLLKGYLPKIIWLRFGNSSNLKVVSKLVEHQSAIVSFIANSEVGILEIY